MRVGFSLSPGGLLLPYHLGVLDSLQYHGFLTNETPIAGSSAGAIAAASRGCNIDSARVLDATIDISDRCTELGGARGRLLPLLKEKLEDFITPEQFEALQERNGDVVIAYRELFPNPRAIHQSDFEHRQDLMNAVCHSSMFPFFASNWPVAVDTSNRIPRVLVDGFFAVPRARFGCPDFEKAGVHVDRTVTVSVFPRDSIGLDASHQKDCISPAVAEEDGGRQLENLLRLATQASSASEMTKVYESGWEDAERWCREQTFEDLHGVTLDTPSSLQQDELN